MNHTRTQQQTCGGGSPADPRPVARRMTTMVLMTALLLVATSRGGFGQSFDYFDGLEYDASIPDPASVLGYEIGEHFTRQGDMLRYLEMLAETSDRVELHHYGKTFQRRPLVYLTISSPENLARLDDILADNRRLADPAIQDTAAESIIDSNPAIVWFSYNVHGNEPSTTETAIQLAYTMAAGTNDQIVDILENVVLVIDPLLNPDGRARYVNWYQTVLGSSPNENPDAAEHHEPWPGGRTNHYYFDLNRDWVWLIHPESQQRLRVYRQHLPQLHVDFHEQGWLSPYFFGAGDTPYNLNIPQATREWVGRYGDANAEAFDREGLVYSSRERFDYLYPGYGKVLPVYHGAVGMLAEKAGHSRAGLSIKVSERYTLTLRERAYHHWLLSMSNLEATAAMRQEQLQRFRDFFVLSASGEHSDVAAYIISPDNDPALLEKLWTLCDSHGIEIGQLQETVGSEALHDYFTGELLQPRSVSEGAWIIRTDQPLGRLVNALFERDPELEDHDTYDITAWSVPLSFGLQAWYTHAPLEGASERLAAYDSADQIEHETGDGNVAIIIDAEQYQFSQAIASAIEHDIFARVAGEQFVLDDRSVSLGSLIVHRIRNSDEAVEALLHDCREANLAVHYASTGMSESGPVLGANANRRLILPKVILPRGPQFSSLSFGQHWHLLDVAQPLPYLPVDLDRVGRMDLSEHNVLLLPSGRGISEHLPAGELRSWIRRGGVVVASGSSAQWASRELLGLTREDTVRSQVEDDRYDEDPEQEEEDDDDDETEREPQTGPDATWQQRQDYGAERRVPGSTVRIEVDTTHPLAAGLPEQMSIIKRGTSVLPVDDDGYVVARFSRELPVRIGGWMSEENEKSLAGQPMMTHHRLGRGAVICLSDDVTLRGFQHGPMRLLMNAIIYGPTLHAPGR